MLTVSRYSNGSNRLRCLTLIFASGVMTAVRRGLKVKVIGQGQRFGLVLARVILL